MHFYNKAAHLNTFGLTQTLNDIIALCKYMCNSLRLDNHIHVYNREDFLQTD